MVRTLVASNQSLEVSSATRLGETLLGEFMNLLLGGATSVSTGGDIGSQGRKETAVNIAGAGAGGLDGQALLLLLGEGDNGGHCDRKEEL